MTIKRVSLILFYLVVYGILSILFTYGRIESSEYPQGTVLWKGHYKDGFESQLFRPCGSDEWWWAKGNLEKIYAVIAPDGVLPDKFTTVYVELTGEVSPDGSYGHLNALNKQIEMSDVFVVEKEIPNECP